MEKDFSGLSVAGKRRAHFIGIGGISMSGLAQVLLARGWRVSGSDLSDSPLVGRLRGLGAQVSIGHRGENLPEVDLVVQSDAIAADNPELIEARKRGLTVLRRSQLLSELTAEMRTIAVSGTHGKTTTTAMIATILEQAGLSPTMFLGGEYPPLGGNVAVGRGEWAVVEACEAFSSFLDLTPTIAVILNIEAEHLDYHGSEEALRAAFLEFLRRVKPEGAAVICADDPDLVSLVRQASLKRIVDYSVESEAAFRADGIVLGPGGSEFVLQHFGQAVTAVTLQAPGMHNVSNALAALAAASLAGVDLKIAAAALADFRGVKRRTELIARARGITILDDYAHHPTEIAAVFAAVRQRFPGRLLVVFQPHLYSRTQTFLRQFAEVLSTADLTWVTDIYPAREAPLPGVNSGRIAELAQQEFGGKVEYLPFDAVVAAVLQQAQEGDIVITMGAGDVERIARGLAESLSDDSAARR